MLQVEASGPLLQFYRGLPCCHGQETQVPGSSTTQKEQCTEPREGFLPGKRGGGGLEYGHDDEVFGWAVTRRGLWVGRNKKLKFLHVQYRMLLRKNTVQSLEKDSSR
jgi:hypothetical protein